MENPVSSAHIHTYVTKQIPLIVNSPLHNPPVCKPHQTENFVAYEYKECKQAALVWSSKHHTYNYT